MFMVKQLIARHRECLELQKALDSDESEFVTVCGRRRIGKTFLVEQFFDGKYDFKYVGGHNKRTRDQLNAFARAIHLYSGKPQMQFSDWYQAFNALEDYLSSLGNERRIVIFIDEMPWMDTNRSNFVTALESFCIRSRIYIRPFTLKETEEYLEANSFTWDRYQILQTYMFSGGVPFYLKMLDNKLSLAQNIDALCFNENGQMREEFDELYNAIFPGADSYISVAKILAENRNGLTRNEISIKTKLSGTFLTRVLKNLERCNFIDKTNLFGNRKTEAIYRMVDYFTLFYFKFIESNLSKDEYWWTHHIESRSISSWMGLTFELICLGHHTQIKKALGVSGMATSVSTWRCKPDEESGTSGAQIDLIIERADRIIHLCELKFSKEPYGLTKDYAEKIRNRSWLFKTNTQTKKSVVNTFVTTFGLGAGKNHSIVHSEVTMDDLFNS